MTTDELSRFTESLGMGARIARQMQGLAMKRRNRALPELPPEDFGKKNWAALREQVSVPNLEIVDRVVSPEDGFARYVFRGKDDQLFESVRIPLMHRPGDEKYIVCVSSQVGCSAACAFCETGKMGFKRNLEIWEIVDQVVKVQEDSQFPVRGIVFMGMGEPMLNYERVMKAAKIMTEPAGLAIDGKAITISTVGIVPGIRRFIADNPSFRLILSLTSAVPERREELLPITKMYNHDKLIQVLREYHEATGKRVPLAWTVISGVNTGEDEAIALAKWLGDLPVMIDLIPVNDATGRFKRASHDELQQFLNHLRLHVKQPIVCRYSGGFDIGGACGMLAGQNRMTQNSSATLPN
jgi:23S rRNA (adenine2503-C2)-methyltransferase